MKLEDLDLRELLEFDPKGGAIRFAGQRALLLDAVALGLLRKELIDTLGAIAARGVLTRFGFAHGWRTAENLRRAIPWDDVRDWQVAGGRLHTLQGLVVVEGIDRDLPETDVRPLAEAIWHDSYEAEQHLLHVGRADEAVCWTLCGFASGYLSFSHGKEVFCVEDRCQGRGDAACHMTGRSRDAWGDAIVPHLPFFEAGCMDADLRRTTEALRDTEKLLRTRRRELQRVAGIEDDPSGIVARSEAMRGVLELARRVAAVDSTVLVTGESGVGKERLARLIHDASARSGGPFLAINCAAVPETLLESELFGHARGSFTGADADRTGLFEAAAGGTLLLDEVGEIPPAMQAKLLRVLQEREVRRVGENRARKVDARVLAATNRALEAEVAAGRFRQDLYYRLRVVELRVPPLRARPDDVLPLARILLASSAQRFRRKVSGLTPAVTDLLVRYAWPGNVRELENAMERAVALAQGDRIVPEDLPEEIRAAATAPRSAPGIRPLAEVEREHVLAALDAHGGNQARTAAVLGIGTATLYRKLKTWATRAPG
jgi:DNA-binding NtrC family response regulator